MLSTAIAFGIMLLTLSPGLAGAGEYAGVLSDPSALGGWLYQSRCARCHFDYGKERLAQGFDSQRELVAAIADGGCRIAWARVRGGEFGRQELQALAEYMRAWEESGGEPWMPELPPLLPEEPVQPVLPDVQEKYTVIAVEKNEKMILEPPLLHLIKNNSVAFGGWLYTGNCYRCHLGYEKARMGKGLVVEKLQRFIREGKTSTQMKPFSRALGGNLKNNEIMAIIEYISSWEQAGEPLAIATQLLNPPEQDPTDLLPLRLPRFPGASGNTAAGNIVYLANCRSCHGSDGGGNIGPSLRKPQGVLRPDLFLKSIVKRGVPVSLMPAWDINGGGSLSAKEIEDVIFYILQHRAESDQAVY